jgi:hypothetical protein
MDFFITTNSVKQHDKEILLDKKDNVDYDMAFDNTLWTYDIDIHNFIRHIQNDSHISNTIIKNDESDSDFFYYGIRKNKKNRVFFIMKPGFYYKYNENTQNYVINTQGEQFNLLDPILIKQLNQYKYMKIHDYIYSLYLSDNIYYDDVLYIFVVSENEKEYIKLLIDSAIDMYYKNLKDKIVYT